MVIDGYCKQRDSICSFLMIGQSNMAGRGNIGDVDPINNPSCYMLRMGRWQPMREPINPDRPIFDGEFRSGVCLAASFANHLSLEINRKIGLIPCADGGTKIDQWMPGELLYDHALMMTKLAMRSSTLCGILWHQGESDCNSESDVESYKSKFIKMITAFRADLGINDIPVIIGELSENSDLKWGMEDRPLRLNTVMREISDELPECRLVSAKGLTLNPDGLHFDSGSLRELGRRYCESYLSLASCKPTVKAFDKLPQDSKDIREKVFVTEQGFNEEFDTLDHSAIHFVAYLNGCPAGTCRIFTQDDEQVWFLGRLAVLPEYRGNNIGKALVAEAEKYALANGGCVIKLHSQCRAKEFYKKCGYIEYGDIEYEEYCPHIWMKKIFNDKQI